MYFVLIVLNKKEQRLRLWNMRVPTNKNYFSVKSYERKKMVIVVIFNEVHYTNPPLSNIPQNYKCIPNLNNIWPFLLTFTGQQTLLNYLNLVKTLNTTCNIATSELCKKRNLCLTTWWEQQTFPMWNTSCVKWPCDHFHSNEKLFFHNW